MPWCGFCGAHESEDDCNCGPLPLCEQEPDALGTE